VEVVIVKGEIVGMKTTTIMMVVEAAV